MELNDYHELILQHRPALKPNSAKTYAVSLNSLSPKDATNFGWLDDVDYVLSQLEKYKDTTRKNVLNAVIVVSEKDGEPFKRYTTVPTPLFIGSRTLCPTLLTPPSTFVPSLSPALAPCNTFEPSLPTTLRIPIYTTWAIVSAVFVEQKF